MVKKLLAHFTPRKRGVKAIGNRPPKTEKLFPRRPCGLVAGQFDEDGEQMEAKSLIPKSE
jgi:hypothetical protein